VYMLLSSWRFCTIYWLNWFNEAKMNITYRNPMLMEEITAKRRDRLRDVTAAGGRGTLGVVVVVFLICLCPYYFVTLTGQDNLLHASSAAFVICLFYFNSCLNPLIYAFFYPWFRKLMYNIGNTGLFKLFARIVCHKQKNKH
uniref:G-protein coupled receptors family 1 profile domain-containing protein n=1 Tax=Mastacembelus armatus TaxID=205130 RepID=A0A3Q3KJU8_9TELE